MCILFFAVGCHPRYKLILLSNRDEYYDRPTSLAHFWEDDLNILDLKRNGTWLGVTKKGRFAAVTNYRVAFSEMDFTKKSRGALIPAFLQSSLSAEEWLAKELIPHADDYDLFNIVVRDEHGQMCYFSNKNEEHAVLTPGKVYAVSNRLLDTEWPKLVNGKQQLRSVLDDLLEKAERAVESETEEEKREQKEEGMRDLNEELHESLFKILTDRTKYPDDDLPDTGVGIDWERLLCPIFVDSDTYGTRSSTLILVDSEDKMTFVERARQPHKDGSTSPSAPMVEGIFKIDLKEGRALPTTLATSPTTSSSTPTTTATST